MLALFAEFEGDILRERVRAEIVQARKEGKPHGRLPTMAKRTDCISVSRPRRSRVYCNRSNLHLDRVGYIENTIKNPEKKIFAIAALFDWHGSSSCQGWEEIRASVNRDSVRRLLGQA